METCGALARRLRATKFNYMHDYDVIIIGHELERARFKYWHAIAADECLS